MTSVHPTLTHDTDKPLGIFVGILNALVVYVVLGLLVAFLL